MEGVSMLRKCQHCGDGFTPYMGRQRFSTPECSATWFQNERREAVKRYRETERGSNVGAD
jgi:uncharacterized Zn ribbon protein